MAFALTAFVANGTQTDEALTKYFKETVEMTITGTSADVALDLSNYSGTFWTAVLASSPTIAPTALQAIKDISLKAHALYLVGGETILQKQPSGSAAAATGQYSVTVTNHIPDIEFFAGEGVTSQVLVLEWTLVPGVDPVAVVLP